MEDFEYNYTVPNNTIFELPTSSITTVGVENLYPALIECFGIIGLGYIAGR